MCARAVKRRSGLEMGPERSSAVRAAGQRGQACVGTVGVSGGSGAMARASLLKVAAVRK